MATLNIENKVAALQTEKALLDTKILDFEIKLKDTIEKLEAATGRRAKIEVIITELTN
jgi:hypothetical protein